MSTLLKPANLRLDLSRRMMSEAPLTEEESQNQAATKLQSSYRGKLSRKQHSFSSPPTITLLHQRPLYQFVILAISRPGP